METVCGSEWCPKWKECGRAIDNRVGGYAQVENLATYGSVTAGIDSNGIPYIKRDMCCGPYGNYAMFISNKPATICIDDDQ